MHTQTPNTNHTIHTYICTHMHVHTQHTPHTNAHISHTTQIHVRLTVSLLQSQLLALFVGEFSWVHLLKRRKRVRVSAPTSTQGMRLYIKAGTISSSSNCVPSLGVVLGLWPHPAVWWVALVVSWLGVAMAPSEDNKWVLCSYAWELKSINYRLERHVTCSHAANM